MKANLYPYRSVLINMFHTNLDKLRGRHNFRETFLAFTRDEEKKARRNAMTSPHEPMKNDFLTNNTMMNFESNYHILCDRNQISSQFRLNWGRLDSHPTNRKVYNLSNYKLQKEAWQFDKPNTWYSLRWWNRWTSYGQIHSGAIEPFSLRFDFDDNAARSVKCWLIRFAPT